MAVGCEMVLYLLFLYVNNRLVKYFGEQICLYYLWLSKLSWFSFTFWNLRSPYLPNPQINYSVKIFLRAKVNIFVIWRKQKNTNISSKVNCLTCSAKTCISFTLPVARLEESQACISNVRPIIYKTYRHCLPAILM